MKRTLAIAITALAALAAPALGAKPAPKNLTIGATPTTIKFGGIATLAGKLNGSNNANRPVTVEQDPFPLDTFTNAGSTTTNATGDWLLGVKPTVNTRYRARSGNADSKTVDVMVRPAITLKLSDRTPARGQRVRFSGTLCPEHDGVAIALQKRTPTGSWRTVARPVLKDVAGATCSSYAKGRRVRSNSAYRARFLGDADHVAGNSRVRRARVH
jgi:hypothetical protein